MPVSFVDDQGGSDIPFDGGVADCPEWDGKQFSDAICPHVYHHDAFGEKTEFEFVDHFWFSTLTPALEIIVRVCLAVGHTVLDENDKVVKRIK